MYKMKTERRSLLKKLLGTVIGVGGLGFAGNSKTINMEDKVSINIHKYEDEPLFAASTRFGNLVFVSGTGPDAGSVHEIKSDTDFALKKMEKRLIEAGTSMQKVLKTTVFLHDIADFKGMNEVFKGRFGKNPPARSTVAVAKGGIPGSSIIEIECIAYI